jgi:two-component system capsular synthesis response regulator RcsB
LDLKVVIADDHPVVLLGTTATLAADPRQEFEVVGTAKSVVGLFELLARSPCEVLLTDFSMPSGELADGLAMIKRIRHEYPKVQIVVLSRISSTHTLRALQRLDVMGLYDKRDGLGDLPRAVRLAGVKRRYVSPRYQQKLEEPNDPLSTRELEVLRLFAKGLSGREIASLTQRSEKTVTRQKRNAMDKLGLVHDGALLDYIHALDATL